MTIARLITWVHRYALLATLVCVGIFMRARQLYFNRSLWVDEAMLALNIIDRDYWGFLRPLDLDQHAPVLYLFMVKASAIIFGSYAEWTLRLPSVIASIASLLIFALWAHRFYSLRTSLVATTMFATSYPLIYYSAEVKQYSFDALFGCIALCLSGRRATPLLVALCCLIVPWLSHGAVFLFAGVVCAHALHTLIERQYVAFAKWFLCGLGLSASFMVFMLTLGRHSASSTYLREFWSAAFAPFPPQSFVDAKWYSDTFFTTFEYAGLFHVQGLAAALAVLGLIHWFQVDKTRGFAYLVTIAMLLVASGMRLYPFESRFLLGIIPGLFALTCVGLERVIEAPLRRPFESRILIFFLLFTTILSGIKHLGTPFEKEEVKPLIQEYLQLSRNGDILYVLRNAASQYRYYEQLFNLDDNGTIISNVRVANDLEYELELQSVPSGSSIWVLSSGMPARPRWRSENAAIRIISRTHELNKEYTATGAALFHYHHRSGHMSESQLIDP